MSKRYVFWRDSTGKPYKRDDDKHTPCAILDAMGNSSFINSNEQVAFQSMAFFKWEYALFVRIAVLDPTTNRELNSEDAKIIIRAAIHEIVLKQRGKKPICAAELLKKADEIAAEFYRRRPISYVLITGLSISTFPASVIRIGNCKISPISTRRRYPFPDTFHLNIAPSHIADPIRSGNWQQIRVQTSGRTIHEAISEAFRSINLLRSLWTFFETYGSWLFGGGDYRVHPLGVIHSGPIHTLHYPDGTLVDDIYWYEPHFIGSREIFQPRKGWEKTEQDRKKMMRYIRHSPYQNDIEDLLIRFVGALDYADANTTFIQLWSILEKITSTVGTKYDETIERATWIFDARNIVKDMLMSVRCRRNQYVHSANSGGDADQIAQIVRTVVEMHLLRLIRNDFRVTSLEEYAEFLAMPTDMAELNRRCNKLRKALKMRKRWAQNRK